jgi:hypothetical protein
MTQRMADPAAPSSAQPDCLFLVGGRSDEDIAGLADRLGLTDVSHGDTPEAAIVLKLLDTRMVVYRGAAAFERWRALSANASVAIGGTSVDPPDADALLAVELISLPYPHQSAHLAAVQQLCVAAVALGSAVGTERLYWPPACLWSPFAALTDAVAALEAPGLPPVLHLVAMTQGAAAAGNKRLRTRGLAHFCNAELALDHPDSLSATDAVQRLSRLAIHAMIVGPMQAGAMVAGLAPGEQLQVGPTEPGAPPTLPVRLLTGRH